MIQRRGAVHLDEADETTATNVLLEEESVIPLPPHIDRRVLELVPEFLAREHVILPIRFDGHGTLVFVAANPHECFCVTYSRSS